jgi:hypothetical protein
MNESRLMRVADRGTRVQALQEINRLIDKLAALPVNGFRYRLVCRKFKRRIDWLISEIDIYDEFNEPVFDDLAIRFNTHLRLMGLWGREQSR